MSDVLIGIHVPGDSVLHRARAGVKLAALLVLVTAVVLLRSAPILASALVATVLVHPLLGLGIVRPLRAALRLWPFVTFILLIQGLTPGWQRAAVLVLQLLVSVLLAGLLTLTTRVEEMLDLFQRLAGPMRHLGVSPWRIALVLALTIRCVPLVSGAVKVSREAYLARGMKRPTYQVVVPVIVRLLRSSEAIGEAISARGLDTDPAVRPGWQHPVTTP